MIPYKKWIYRRLMPRGANPLSLPRPSADWQSVTLPGLQASLAADIRYPAGEPTGWAVLCHPYKSAARTYFYSSGLADWYSARGWIVLIFDFNGFGDSPFTGFDYSKDILAAVRYATSQTGGKHIAVHGLSFGAAQALRAATAPDHGIESLIVENSLDNYLSYFRKRKPLMHALLAAMHNTGIMPNRLHDYIMTTAAIRQPPHILFIYNQSDTLTTPAMGQALMRVLPYPSHFILCKGGHLEAIDMDTTYYSRQLERFLKG